MPLIDLTAETIAQILTQQAATITEKTEYIDRLEHEANEMSDGWMETVKERDEYKEYNKEMAKQIMAHAYTLALIQQAVAAGNPITPEMCVVRSPT
jgi:hypothetical protein